jgi:hypothetical protein
MQLHRLLGALTGFFRHWSTTRLLAVCTLGTFAAILAIIVATTPAHAPPPATDVAPPHAVAPAPVDARPTTEIVTHPAGAEIISRGALVANSPARVPRPSYESLYLVRLRGYQPQLVSLSPISPETIQIDLLPLVEATPNSNEIPEGANAQNTENPQ